jgi:hypothetical protein
MSNCAEQYLDTNSAGLEGGQHCWSKTTITIATI